MPQYGSRYKAFRVNIRPQIDEYHPTMPVIVRTIPEMVAEFGVHRDEVQVETPEGVERFGDIAGNFYDLDADSAQKGWTDEEYQIAQARLDALCQTWPAAIWRITAAPAVAPWPTYDDTHHFKIAALAETLGLVEQALTYERENKAREGVLKALEEKLGVRETEEELTAAV